MQNARAVNTHKSLFLIGVYSCAFVALISSRTLTLAVR